MVKAIWFLILLGVFAWGAAVIAGTESSVTLEWLGYRVDTSIGVLVALTLVAAAVLTILYRVWTWFRTAPRRFRRWRQDGRRRRGYKALTQGMVAVAAGDAVEARRQARKAEKLLAEPPLTMLLSAQAAQLSGDDEAAGEFFEAMSEQKETRYLGLRGQLNQAMQDGDEEGALELAEQVADLEPKRDTVAETLFDLQVKKRHWSDAEETVRKSVKNKTIDGDVGRRRRAVLMYEQSIDAEAEGKLDDALQLARKANNLAPRFVPAAVRTARLLNGAGKRRKAASIIEESWVANPHPQLAQAMEELNPGGGAQEKLRVVERLANYNKDHAESHLAVAKVALEAGQWQVAREHLEAVAADQPTARVCRYLAELEEAENNDGDAARNWLRRAAVAEPDSAWVCDNCGNVTASWTPVCGRCGHFDSFEWTSPPRVTTYNGDEFHHGETIIEPAADADAETPPEGNAEAAGEDSASPEARPT